MDNNDELLAEEGVWTQSEGEEDILNLRELKFRRLGGEKIGPYMPSFCRHLSMLNQN